MSRYKLFIFIEKYYKSHIQHQLVEYNPYEIQLKVKTLSIYIYKKKL